MSKKLTFKQKLDRTASRMVSTYSKNEKAAMNRFCETYLNTGCDEDEAKEFTEFVYKRLKVEHGNEDAAISALHLEQFRYEDM